MLVCKVIGSLISTHKDNSIKGKKLMIVQEKCATGTKKTLIAIDCVDAGTGDTVLVVVEGGSSRKAAQCINGPVDAAIIGVVDHE